MYLNPSFTSKIFNVKISKRLPVDKYKLTLIFPYGIKLLLEQKISPNLCVPNLEFYALPYKKLRKFGSI